MFYDHEKAKEESQQPRKGWDTGFDCFTTEDAPGSIPGGMPVKSIDESVSGKVLGSMLNGKDIIYYIQWDNWPKRAWVYHGSGNFKIA